MPPPGEVPPAKVYLLAIASKLFALIIPPFILFVGVVVSGSVTEGGFGNF